ncbi:hypothetical protein NEIMUCOT_05266 [Neisseria mucosa ATCC 25996]|uniref:Uncharacterized protein n=1 Tax=Neisseria mucosa (strain ATCC 25996 / DSM 4631 / NCTC 10774 / M26) TaxID=546266 RepID=D2ZXB6_NEIM2|nr:hypothetical protein NEIMUCOT_05266 [Neisseria mucosa ATCC 25996]
MALTQQNSQAKAHTDSAKPKNKGRLKPKILKMIRKMETATPNPPAVYSERILLPKQQKKVV